MDIELVQFFVQIVKSGGFSRAAEALRLPKSTLSKALTRLEHETGTKLLIRTTRTQTLTAAGKAFYDSCVAPLDALENAQKSLYGNDNLMSGTVKITAPEDMGSQVIAPAAARLSKNYPLLNFELIYTDQVLDLVKEGFDLAFRIGRLKESALKVKKVGEVRLIVVASPEYLKANEKIHKVDDLQKHSCLALALRSTTQREWVLKSKSSTVRVTVKPRIVSNQMSSLIQAALAHGGLALVPAFLAQPFLKTGELIHVLPQWTSPGLPVSLLSPLPFSSSARLRLTADHLASEVQRALLI